MTRVVLDANQYVSAIFVPTGNPARILTAWRQAYIDVCVSPPILSEIRRVLRYPRLQKRHQWDEATIDTFVQSIASAAYVTSGTTIVQAVADDPTDDKYLACALESSAAYVVTGDQHLLRLQAWHGIYIVTAAVFIQTVLSPPPSR